MTEVEIFTDGACKGNPGPGGWAAIVVPADGGAPQEISGGDPATTNKSIKRTILREIFQHRFGRKSA